jgi:hypothetical protein
VSKKIGILVGRENTFPQAFIDEVNRREAGVTAEFVSLGGTAMDAPAAYALIVDRISHEVPYYRAFLKNAMLAGTYVVNNPFWWSADDKFTGAAIATRIGVAHPKSIALPSHSYIADITSESLRNLQPRIPWEQHVEAVGGFPLILKPHSGGGFKQVFKLHSMEQLWEAYNQTGTECMMLQQFVEWDKYVRCWVVGRERVLVMKFDVSAPYPHRYFDEPGYLTDEEQRRVEHDALALCRALGYDMNTVEFALKDGVPYAIDFTNPAPDADYYALKERFFRWVVDAMADFCIAKALEHPRPIQHPSWRTLLLADAGEAVPQKKKKSRKKDASP